MRDQIGYRGPFGRFGVGLARIGVLALAAACGATEPPPPPPPPPPPTAATCSGQAVLQLAVGQHQVLDATQASGCARVPQAAGSGAEYVVVVASGTGNRSSAGISGGYQLLASSPGSAVSSPTAALGPADIGEGREPSAQSRFDLLLRQRETELSRDPAIHFAAPSTPVIAAAPPLVGDVRTFKTCNNLTCTAFTEVPATARFVGSKAAIYMDNTVPTADTLLAEDYADLGRTFDEFHYPIDSAAFGTESDLDNNQRIIILMTDAVNDLTPDCTDGRILGYFFGLDLITVGSQAVNSNKAEVFYTFVPAPANSTNTCRVITRATAVANIKPTLIHELQHMISWNRRVIVGGGLSEETWLNEAMSHFGEELGGRLIPNSECQGFSSCRSQYASSDIINAHDFFSESEDNFLVYPTSSSGTLAERGASWSFLRWVIDQFATDTLIGNDFTPSMVTGSGGAGTFSGRTGVPFATLVTEWLLAAYLDDQPGFVGQSDRLRFKSWGLRAIWTNPANNQIFPEGFPIKPDSTAGGYSRTGTLRAGSGGYLRLIQAANGPAIDVQLVGSSGAAINPILVPRIGIARVR